MKILVLKNWNYQPPCEFEIISDRMWNWLLNILFALPKIRENEVFKKQAQVWHYWILYLKNIKLKLNFPVKEHHIQNQDYEEFKFKPPPITGTVEERCHSALEHVSSGLECLKYFPTEPEDHKDSSSVGKSEDKSEKNKHEFDDATHNMAKPFQAIPMPYAPLHPNTLTDDVQAVSSSADSSPR